MTRIILTIAALALIPAACGDTIIAPEPQPVSEKCTKRSYHSTDNETYSVVVEDSVFTTCEVEYE